jgi:hypothetical protein
MDPSAIGIEQWAQLGSLLKNLWMVVLFIILFAANMLIGHNFIPSFVESHHISRSWQKVRPVLYALAIASVLVAIFFLTRVIGYANDVLSEVWPVYFL